MPLSPPRLPKDKKKIGIAVILGGLLLWFIISFWKEIGDTLFLVWNILRTLTGYEAKPVDADTLLSPLVMAYSCLVSFGLFFAAWMMIISFQALLPVTKLQEVYRTGWHLLLFIFGKHGPAIFINNGKEIAGIGDKERAGAGQGVIVVDFNSALVLESLVGPPSVMLPITELFYRFLVLMGLSDPPGASAQSQRAIGPGVVFMRADERIRGTIDLRKQSRFRPGVQAYTGDGIELKTDIFVLFTVGQVPDILQITYVGERKTENLRAVTTSPVGRGKVRVEFLPIYELSSEDQESIWQSTRRGFIREKYSPPEVPPFSPTFSPQRVFSAISSKARDSKHELTPWDSLPIQVASDYFREIMFRYKHDQLYQSDKQGRFPLPEIKKEFNNMVRNNGLLRYRMVVHRNFPRVFLQPVGAKQDMIVNEGDLMVSPTYLIPDAPSKILRERGIKVIASGFLELDMPEEIYEQRLNTLRTSWEVSMQDRKNFYELESSRVRRKARDDTRRVLQEDFKRIVAQFKVSDVQKGEGEVASQIIDEQINNWRFDDLSMLTELQSSEALLIQLMEAVKEAASDPKTRQLLPTEALDLVNNINSWLFSDEMDPK